MTLMFGDIVFGPVKSRRFGVSLGINLLPLDAKFCSFNCIYCECGLTFDEKQVKPQLNTAEQVKVAMQIKFEEMSAQGTPPDVITFAGNGEPTMHPEFVKIIDYTIALRDTYFPHVKITVLSNSTFIHKAEIREALMKIENNVMKLDAGTEAVFQAINRPNGNITLAKVVNGLMEFKGNLVVQTMLVRGIVDGKKVDNTTEEELAEWLKHIALIKPRLVILYPIDRETPYQSLEKVPKSEFEILADKIKALGINVQY